MRYPIFRILCLVGIVALVTAAIGCSGAASKSDSLNDLAGVWKSVENGKTIQFNFNGEQKTIVIDDKTIPVEVKVISSDKIDLNVKGENGQTDVWKLSKIWDDNGSTYKLGFFRNGQRDTLRRG